MPVNNPLGSQNSHSRDEDLSIETGCLREELIRTKNKVAGVAGSAWRSNYVACGPVGNSIC